jgi:hypothetical protein
MADIGLTNEPLNVKLTLVTSALNPGFTRLEDRMHLYSTRTPFAANTHITLLVATLGLATLTPINAHLHRHIGDGNGPYPSGLQVYR